MHGKWKYYQAAPAQSRMMSNQKYKSSLYGERVWGAFIPVIPAFVPGGELSAIRAENSARGNHPALIIFHMPLSIHFLFGYLKKKYPKVKDWNFKKKYK